MDIFWAEIRKKQRFGVAMFCFDGFHKLKGKDDDEFSALTDKIFGSLWKKKKR